MTEQEDITFYGETESPASKRTIQYLHSRGLPYNYVNVYTSDGRKEFDKLELDRPQVPVVTYKNQAVIGFNEARLDRLLDELINEEEVEEEDTSTNCPTCGNNTEMGGHWNDGADEVYECKVCDKRYIYNGTEFTGTIEDEE